MKNKKLIFASLLVFSGKCVADSNLLEDLANQSQEQRIKNLSELVCKRTEALSLEELQKLLDSGKYTDLLNESEEVTTSKEDQEACKQCLLALLSAKRQISLENSNTTPIQPILNEIPQIATENIAPAQVTVEEPTTTQPEAQQVTFTAEDFEPSNTLPINKETGLLDTSSIEPKEVNTALKEEIVEPKVENTEFAGPEETTRSDVATAAEQEETPKIEEKCLPEKDPQTGIETPNYAGQQ